MIVTLQLASNVSGSRLQIGIGDSIDVFLSPAGLFMPSEEVLTGVLAVSGGGSHTCALMLSFNLRCWGSNTYGQLGNDTVTSLSTPPAFDIPFVSNVAAVSAGGAHTCVLTFEGGVRCWGRNTNGQVESCIATMWCSFARLIHLSSLQLGDGSTMSSNTASVDVISGVSMVSAGLTETCVIMSSNGGVRCWGKNMYNEVGFAFSWNARRD